jgi:hypothetical protein
MIRLPKKRGITQAERDKSLILRHVLTYLEPVPNLFFHWSGHPPPQIVSLKKKKEASSPGLLPYLF